MRLDYIRASSPSGEEGRSGVDPTATSEPRMAATAAKYLCGYVSGHNNWNQFDIEKMAYNEHLRDIGMPR
jgi:hypothetical protein